MQINNNDFIVAYDIDGTMITLPKDSDSTESIMAITDPYTGTVKLRVAYLPHIELMKKHKEQGYFIKVWSNGGSLWAKTVIERLNLTHIVDSIEAKPTKYVDDLDVKEWLGTPIFVKED